MARKLALVTGASGGIGLEFAKLLAADGYDLALVARSESKLNELAQSLRASHGIDAQPVVQDLAEPGAAAAVFARVPSCDVLINNAGFGSNGRFDSIPEKEVHDEVAVDVLALTELTRKYLPGMIARGDGKIMNVASTAGFLPGPFMAVYYASKSYVIFFSEALWEELRGTGVTVTCFCLGATDTGFADRANMKETVLFKLPRAKADAMARSGYAAMMRGKRLHVPAPLQNWFVSISPHVTPRRLLLWFSRKAVEVDRA